MMNMYGMIGHCFILRLIVFSIVIGWFIRLTVRNWRFLIGLFGYKDYLEKYNNELIDLRFRRGVWIFRIGYVLLLLAFVLVCSLTIVICLDIPSIIKKDYQIVEGYVVQGDTGGKEYDESRCITVEDVYTKEKVEGLELYTGRIEEGKYLKIAYLPHTKCGYILERE